MEAIINEAAMIETGVLAFLLALSMTWMGLQGLFRLMPKAAAVQAPIRVQQNDRALPGEAASGRHAA